jgi:hypothetical protein
MTTDTTTDELRAALAVRAQAIDVPAAPPVRLLRQRVLVDRLRAATTVATILLLVTAATAVVLRPSSSPSTVDTRFGAPAPGPTTTAATANSTAPPVSLPADGRGRATPAAGFPTSTTVTVPGHAGPIQLSDSPPTTRGAGEPTYAVAQTGTWRYHVDCQEEGADNNNLVGTQPSSPRSCKTEPLLRTRPPQARTQELQDDNGINTAMTVSGSGVRTLADTVILRELRIAGNTDTRKIFTFPQGVLEVPAKKDRGRTWSFEGTSTDGATHLKVTAKMDGEDLVWLEDGYHTTVETVKVDWVIELSGDRTARIQRSMWWATDLGIPAKIHEVETSTTSKGQAYKRDVTAQVTQATAGPDSVNGQVAPDDDQDGIPNSADNTPSG